MLIEGNEISGNFPVLLKLLKGDAKVARITIGGKLVQDVRIGKIKVPGKALIGQQYGATICNSPGTKCWDRVQRSEVVGVGELEEEKDEIETKSESGDPDKMSFEDNVNSSAAETPDADESMHIGHVRAKNSALKSTTFLSKTRFSQEKYLRKKHEKYSREITLLKPTLLDFCESCPGEVRADVLGSVLRFAGVRHGSVCGVVDDTSGSLTTSLIQRGCSIDRYVLGRETGKEKAQCVFGLERSKQVTVFKDLADAPAKLYDALIVADTGSAEVSISGVFESLGGHIKLCGSFVAYSRTIEPLLAILSSLRKPPTDAQETRYINVQLTEQMLREHEILIDRTHPVMNQSANLFQGFVLSAVKVAA